MRHLLVLTGFLLCAQVHADPLQNGNARKPVDYSKSHALSGQSQTTGHTRSALDDLLVSKGIGQRGAGLPETALAPEAETAAAGSTRDPMVDEMTSWLSTQQAKGSVSAAAASFEAQQTVSTASRLADQFATLVVDAISHIGVPYKYGGNSVEAGGFDCSGFVKAVYHEALGAMLPRRSEEQAAATTKIGREELKPGDLVFFKTTRRAFSHVGIYVGDDKFVHAPRSGARIRIENMTDNYWTQRFNGARRVDVADNSSPRAEQHVRVSHGSGAL